jgi:hypothetical protein
MPPRFSYSRGLPSSPTQNQEWRKPGHSLRVTIPSFRLTAFLSGLVLVAISLVQSPDQQEPEALRPLILRGHTDHVNAVAFAPDGRTLASAATFEFTGGTGRFAHASGHGDFIGAITGDFIGTLEADGVISY